MEYLLKNDKTPIVLMSYKILFQNDVWTKRYRTESITIQKDALSKISPRFPFLRERACA